MVERTPQDVLRELQPALKEADVQASIAHDFVWPQSHDTTPTKEEASDAIWRIHELLRPLIDKAIAEAPDSLPRQKPFVVTEFNDPAQRRAYYEEWDEMTESEKRASGPRWVAAPDRPPMELSGLQKYVTALAADCRSSGMEDCGKVLDGLRAFIDGEAPDTLSEKPGLDGLTYENVTRRERLAYDRGLAHKSLDSSHIREGEDK